MYGDVVLGMKPESKEDIDPFEEIMEALKHKRDIELDTEFTVQDLKDLVYDFKEAVKKRTGHDFPTDPWDQLRGAVIAVLPNFDYGTVGVFFLIIALIGTTYLSVDGFGGYKKYREHSKSLNEGKAKVAQKDDAQNIDKALPKSKVMGSPSVRPPSRTSKILSGMPLASSKI